MTINKLAIVGGGQIGTSLAMAAYRKHRDAQITVYDKDPGTGSLISIALAGQNIPSSAIRFANDPYGVDDADLLVLATPTREVGNALMAVARYVGPNTTITDVCSVKTAAIARIAMMQAATGIAAPYVPFHILSGRSGTGPLTADPDIFRAPGILVPGQATEDAEKRVGEFFASLGTAIHKMPADTHDQILGTTSHLEHLIMFALMRTSFIRGLNERRDMTDHGNWLLRMSRIAKSGPKMWADIFVDNKDRVLRTAAGFRGSIAELWQNRRTLPRKVDELHRYARSMACKEITAFPAESLTKKQAVMPALLAFLSLAITDNARRVEQRTRFSLAPIANPSFKDGIGPVAAAPGNVKDALAKYGDALLPFIKEFLAQFDAAEKMVRFSEEREMMQLVEDASNSRERLAKAFERPTTPKPAPAARRPGLG